MLTPAQAATLAAVVDAFAPADADVSAAATAVTTAVNRLAAHRARKLALVLDLLANPFVELALAGRPQSFARLDRDARERALLRLRALGPLRAAFDAFARLSLFAAYGIADERGRSRVWDRLGYPGPRTDVPANANAFPIAVLPASERLRADAIVVGSGAGGGVAAALLARAGLRVVVLEAGPAIGSVAARQRETEALAELYLESGLAASDDMSIAMLAGACVGGGTSVNWSTSLRLPAQLAARWGETMNRPLFAAELADAYDAVEARLGVTVSTSHNRNNGAIVEGCTRLGWSARAIPRNAACSGDRCGYCGFGCAYGTKRGTLVTYLRDAVDAGAAVYANARVERVRIVDGVARGVDAMAADGRTVPVDAPLVVVAAGSLRTPGVLARSGIASPHLGKHLHLHPATAIAAEFAEPVETWHGVMQSALCDRFADLGDGFGAMIEATPSHPGLMAQAMPWFGRDHHAQAMTAARYRASLISLARDRGEGSVGLDERAEVRYRIAADDAQRLMDGLAGAVRIAFAAGATSVSTLHAQPMELTAAGATPAGLDAFARELRERAAKRAPIALYSGHQMGTARIGVTAREGVVDPEGRVFDVDGLLVTDASVFPTASGVNPMLTIMALAHRATSAYLARRTAVPETVAAT